MTTQTTPAQQNQNLIHVDAIYPRVRPEQRFKRFSCTLGDLSSEGFVVMVVMAKALARAALRVGADRMRNCIGSYLLENLQN